MLSIKAFLQKLGQTLESILRIVLLSKFKVDKHEKPSTTEILILGNGPSLTDDLKNYPTFLTNKTLICVNHFPKTDLYQKLKPSIYITGAPDLWLDDIEEKYVTQSKELFEAMQNKTTWPIAFYIPFEAKKNLRWQKQLSGNPNISIHYYNNIPIEGWAFFTYWCFRHNLGMPRPHNVMIPSMMLSLSLGFKTINLLGTDHSWLSEISVTESNEVLINQKHFYDQKTSKGQPLDKRGKGKRTLPELLHKFMTAFNSYFEIEEYAKHKGVKILNATNGSFIDAFEKINLSKNYNETGKPACRQGRAGAN